KLVTIIISKLDSGKERIAYKDLNSGEWVVNEWAKKAVLLSFILSSSVMMSSGCLSWYDKIPLKFQNYTEEEHFAQLKSRMLPGSFIRQGAYIGQNTVIMPSFINIGAYIGDGTMVDSWATIGSCAQIGKNCHISGGVGIGGVLEPISERPVIIEDNCFIGARSEIAEGVIIEEGAVLSMGVYLGSSTKIFDRETGNITYGRVPAYSVVVPGSLPDSKGSEAMLYCAVIVKKVDASTRSKTSINELLRL
ncbi:MAG: 2,3,4,5-tetrahydropyridine-2,6-dicarboxylate N-succinyltransferase, partial [Pseudomonadota bacterium]